MKEVPIKKHKSSILLKVSIFLFALFVVFSLLSQQVKIAEKKEELAQLTEAVKAQEIKNKTLENAFQDETAYKDYLEKSARKDYNYAKPNEKIIIDLEGEG